VRENFFGDLDNAPIRRPGARLHEHEGFVGGAVCLHAYKALCLRNAREVFPMANRSGVLVLWVGRDRVLGGVQTVALEANDAFVPVTGRAACTRPRVDLGEVAVERGPTTSARGTEPARRSEIGDGLQRVGVARRTRLRAEPPLADLDGNEGVSVYLHAARLPGVISARWVQPEHPLCAEARQGTFVLSAEPRR